MSNPEPNGKGANRLRKVELLVAAMVRNPHLEKAAASIGISVSTAQRIRKTPEFETAYRQAREEVVSESKAMMQLASKGATVTLIHLMQDVGVPPGVRAHCADRILTRVDNNQLEEQTAALRRIVLEKAAEQAPAPLSA
jgi:hypothetical protein